MIETTTKLVQIGDYVAKVKVDLIVDDTGWSPFLSHEDALKLDRVRSALKSGDIEAAKRDADVFELTPLT
jgi:hypothetical protein